MAKKILLIGGLGESSAVIKKFLGEMGFTVKICDPTKEALEFAVDLQPDMIIMGSDLPVFSGIELTRMMKPVKPLSNIPFILVTYRKPATVESGATNPSGEPDDYLTIPVTKMSLYSMICKWLGDDAGKQEIPSDTLESSLPKENGNSDVMKGAECHKGSVTPFAAGRILYLLSKSKDTSNLRVAAVRKKMKIAISNGRIVEVQSNYIQEESLGRALVKRGVITEAENEKSFRRAEQMRVKHGDVLVQLGLLTRSELTSAIRQQKEYKAFSLFTPSWNLGTYEAREEPIAKAEEAPLNLSIGAFLRRSILEKKFSHNIALSHFLDQKENHLTVAFSDSCDEVVKWLGLGAEHLTLLKIMPGKTIEELQEIPGMNHSMILRLAFLMAVTETLDFERGRKMESTPAKTPPAPVHKSRPEPAAAEKPAKVPGEEDSGEFGMLLREGLSLFRAGNYRAALVPLQKACFLDDSSSAALTYCSWAEYSTVSKSNLAEIEKIKEALKRAVALDDSNDLAHLYLGKVLKAENQDNQAAYHFKAAFRLNPENEEAVREVKLLEIKQRTQRERGLYRA